jgi:phosphomethylpyrimidine synthase
MTLIEYLKKGDIPKSLHAVAKFEGRDVVDVARLIIEGRVVLPCSNKRTNGFNKPLAIGESLSTKVNANIGTSASYPSLDDEINKLKVAVEAGADTIMDLSTGGNLSRIRRAVLEKSEIPVGTVPIYQAALEAIAKKGSIVHMDVDDLFDVIEKHAADGVDFMTLHTGVTWDALEALNRQPRVTDIVSRGGAFLAGWMIYNEKENPLYEQFERLVEMAKKYDFTISLGDGLRPGSIADSGDEAQFSELKAIGKQVDICRKAGVQAIVEGPGHVPINQVANSVIQAKNETDNAPLYLLGPLVTDIGAGYDHITGAIGGAIAASAGADFLCYVTPREHLGLPNEKDVRLGVIASKIAAHAADISKCVPGAFERDAKMSKARKALNWEEQVAEALDPAAAENMRSERLEEADSKVCTMCGEFCAMDFVGQYLGQKSSVTIRC